MKDKAGMLFALLSLAGTAMGATYYVNPSTDPVTGGNDDWDGTCEVWEGGESLHGPKQTLVGVMEVATTSGDVVIALPGVYSNRLCECNEPDQYARVSVPDGVTLKSKFGPKATIIMGKEADTPADGKYGCGTGSPARCVNLGANSRLVGFTLTGGRTLLSQSGGGIWAGGSYVVNCVISNNVAKQGGAVRGGHYFGCKFMFNRSVDSSYPCNTAYYSASKFVNCFFDCNATSESPTGEPAHGAEFYTGSSDRRITAVNCTFGPHLKKLYYGSKGGIDLYNCINLSAESGTSGESYFNSAYRNKDADASADATSFKTTVAAMALNDDGSPKASSAAVNVGDTSLYNGNVPSAFADLKDFDIAGYARVVGDSIDLGCYEYNPNPDPKNLYVSPSGSDANSGESANQALRTLAMAGRVADWVMRSGDVINVAPGTYDEGVNDEDFVVQSRIHLPQGITLRSTAGAEQTIIKGAASTHEYATAYGNGTNAVRCVRMEAGCRVEGFTLTGGRTSLSVGTNNDEERGGGAYAKGGAAWLVDCIVSNNMAAGRGGAINSAIRSVRCRYIRNAAEDQSMIVYYGPTMFFDCYFAENARGDDSYAVYSTGEDNKISLYNCTFEAGGGQQALYKAVACYNCLFRCPTKSVANFTEFYSCAFVDAPKNYKVLDENCIVKNATQLAIDADGRPKKNSLVIDAGSNLCYTAAYPFQVDEYIDLCRTNRIWNGRIDIGCCEFIPPPPSGLSVLIK